MSLLDDGQFEPSDKYLAHTATAASSLSLPEEIIHGAVATVADIGTTYWNSLTPKAYNASTADLLSRIDGDALQVYNENPDTIKTLSFIGGTILPIGLSIKGMGMLRAGTKGLSWFSEAGQAAQLSAVETAFAAAGRDSAFQAAKWAMYRGMAYNAVADNIVMEAAIVGTLSAHPFMEDYYKDFGSNFLRSVAIGTGIQGVIGGILTKTAINKATGAIEAVPTKMFKEAIVDPMAEAKVSGISHLGQTAQIHIQGIEKLEGQIAAAASGELELGDWTVRLLKSMAAEQRSIVVNSIKDAAQGDLKEFLTKGADADAIKYITDFVAKEGNMGLDKIAFAEASRLTAELAEGVAAGQLKESASLVQTVLKKVKGIAAWKEEIIPTDAIYLPWAHGGEGAYIGKSQASLYLTAADLGQTAEQMASSLGKQFGKAARSDWFIEMPALATSKLDGEFIGATLAIGKLDVKALNAMEIHIGDLPVLKAAHVRVQQLLRENPAEVFNIKVVSEGVVAKVNPAQLEEILVKTQADAISVLQAKNFGIETIALKTGTPLETVEKILADGRVDGAGLIKYSSKEDAELALGFKNRALALSTNMKKVAQPGLRSALDAQDLDMSSSGLVEFFLLSSPSETVQRLGRELLSDEVKTLVSHFADGLQDILSSKMKSTLWASTNQALSAMGPVGVIANAIGKKVIHVKNEMTKLFEEPIANLFGQVIKAGEAELLEFNTSAAVNASIKGRRLYKDGAFWIPSDKVDGPMFRGMLKFSDDQWKIVAADPTFSTLFTKAQYAGKDYDIASPIVRELHERLQSYGREMYEFTNARMKALGKQDLTDIGYWTPSYNPRNKALAYVYDQVDKSVSMLYADSDELLATGIQQYEKAMLAAKGPDFMANLKIVTKKDQAFFNDLAGRHDPLYMQAADITKQHGGASTPTIVSTDTSVMKDILQGYQSQVHRGIEGIVELQLNQSMNMLKGISQISTGVNTPATYNTIKAAISKPVDVGQTVRNILLGRPLLNQHTAWSELQQYTQVGTDMALKVITEAFQPLLAPVIGKMSGVKVRSMEEWTNVLKQMEAKGIVNPFESLDKAFGLGRYMQEGKSGTDALTPRGIALGNGLAASLLLRIGDLAQPFVNAISLPILTSAAVRRQLSGSFMGATLDPAAKFTLAKTMHDGFRFSQHPSFKPWLERGAANGYFSMDIREITELMAHQRSLDPGVITATEQFLEKFSNTPGNMSILRYLTKPADLSEEFVRVQSYATGVLMAKKAYPGISDIGANTFARDFMDQTVGNYTAAQRPALFQGTFGMAMGLFQTYMLTMAQTIYRQVEHRDWASLGKLLLTQSTIFGASSLPGFHNVSNAIATHFSDQHFDLESGTFRALPDEVANILLYGMPSSFGPGIVTRGDIQPRVPNPMQGFQSLALVNITSQAYQGMERVASAAFQADQNAGRAMLEAISLQSVSRPLARLSELAMGQAITSKGDLVADSTSIYTTQGIVSRVMATRPLKEIKAREVLHLNTLYNAADTEKRQSVIGKLKTMVRSGTLDDEKLGTLADSYLRTGTTTGWRSAVNDAIKQEAGGADYVTLNKLKKDSPLKSLLEDIGP